MARLSALGLPFGLLASLFDFDSVEDLRMWRDTADAGSLASMPRTREFLKRLTDLGCLIAD